jgi:phosphopantetheine adenylyltransferase
MFDVAVQSCIHIALQYTELDKAQSIAIFCDVLDQYQKKYLIEQYDAIVQYVKTDLYKKKFDGRQLRNIVTSAMGIAQARPNGRMKLDDVQLVVSNMESFKTNLSYQTQRYQGKPYEIIID